SNSNSDDFLAKWQPSEACQQYCDEEGRVLVKELAQNVVTRITNQAAIVESIKIQEKQQSQPLPFNLSNLQIAAAKQFSMNAKLVLDVCQSLYEKHKLITYPRSDCRYLPKEQFKQAPSIIAKLAQSNLSCNEQAKNADANIKSKAWNDKKITAHHAIIPTEKAPTEMVTNNLSSFEKNIYLLITRKYLLQFYPLHLYQQTQLRLNIAGGIFTCNTKMLVQLGWKVLFPSIEKEQQKKLPPLKQGDVLHCQQGELVEKHTSPPESFTDATLLSAMTGIARFVNDSNIKKVLKDTDGLGTDATRAGIIELLFKRDFLVRQGKKITATEVGKALVNALPIHATLPDMTAQWEANLTAISEKNASYLSFIQPLICTVTDMVNSASQQSFSGLPKVAFKSRKKPKKSKKKTST
ncbi:MAG: DNA topoisomerase III, partial [Colwellia sp.]|nr:DNA topoisomerase III [Colwellia sp.]